MNIDWTHWQAEIRVVGSEYQITLADNAPVETIGGDIWIALFLLGFLGHEAMRDIARLSN